MAHAYWLSGRKAQHRKNSNSPSSPCSEATWLSFSLYVSGLPPSPRATVPPPEPRVSAYKQVIQCMGSLGGCLGFKQLSVSLRWMEFLLIFTAGCHGKSSSLHQCPGWGAQCEDWTPPSSGGTSAAEISLPILKQHTWVWGQPLLCIYLFYQSWRGFFFIYLVIELMFSYSSHGSPGSLFYNLVVITMWSWDTWAQCLPTLPF